jgi:protein gp37
MSDGTKIEWADATWNPITGCSVVSAGCKHCYAMKLAGTRLQHHPSRAGLTQDTQNGPVWTGEVRFNEQWLDQPLKWSKPRMIFVCAHGDLFHESVPDEWIDKIFAVMALSPHHTFQVLTKRPLRMMNYFNSFRDPSAEVRAWQTMDWASEQFGSGIASGIAISQIPKGLPNVWLGVSVENQTTADERIPLLLQTPAAVRWVSAEPLLGLVNLSHLNEDKETNELDCLKPYTWEEEIENWRGTSDDWEAEFLDWYDLTDMPSGLMHPGIDWAVVGGESGSNARPMHPDWARSLRDQLKAAGVPFLFKQWGEWLPEYNAGELAASTHRFHSGFKFHRFEDGTPMMVVGKKSAGRLLDGVQHDGYPEVKP